MLQQDKYFLFGDKNFTIISALSWLYRNYKYVHRNNLYWLDLLLKTVPYTVLPFTEKTFE